MNIHEKLDQARRNLTHRRYGIVLTDLIYAIEAQQRQIDEINRRLNAPLEAAKKAGAVGLTGPLPEDR